MAKRTYKEEMSYRELRSRHVAVREDTHNLPQLRSLSREVELLILVLNKKEATVRSLVARNEQVNVVLALIDSNNRVRAAQNDIREEIREICDYISVYLFGEVLMAELKKVM